MMPLSLLMKIFFFAINFIDIAIAYLFFDGLMERRRRHPAVLAAIGVVLAAVYSYIWLSFAGQNLPAAILASYGLYYAVTLSAFKEKLRIKAIAITFIIVFSLMTELLTVQVLVAFLEMPWPDMDAQPFSYTVGAVVAKLSLLLVVRVALMGMSKKKHALPMKYSLLILSLPLASIYMVISLMWDDILGSTLHPSAVVASCLILYFNLVVYALFESIARSIEENNLYRTRENQLLIQQDQYRNIIEGYRETRRMRHDMANHMIALEGYLMEGRSDAAAAYVRRLHGSMEDASKDIISGNVAVDALINSKRQTASLNGAMLVADIRIPQVLPMDDMDLCIMLGNVLDNAIESCQRMKQACPDCRIDLSMKQADGNLLIRVRNPVDVATLRFRDGSYKSSKTKNKGRGHGNGLFNTNRIVEKHGGNLQIKVVEEAFQLNILVPLKNHGM